MTTLDELQAAVTSALQTGKIGTPVALRVHAVVAEYAFDPAAALDRFVNLAAAVFGDPPERLSARLSTDERQCNLLIQFSGGQTLLLTFASIPPAPPQQGSLHLTLIGNHGIVRLEGAEWFDVCLFGGSTDAGGWRQLIEESCRRGVAVRVAAGS